MAFFKKLKDRLFKSSSKIDEGLEAIVEDGGIEEVVTPQETAPQEIGQAILDDSVAPESTTAPIEPQVEVAPAPIPEPEPEPEMVEVPEEVQLQPQQIPEPLEAASPEPEQEQEPVVVTGPADPPETAAISAEKKPGLLGRLFGRSEKKSVVRRVLDDDMLEQLEELLITTDMGVDTALRVTANMAEGRMGKKLSVDEIKSLLASEIARIMEPVARPLPIYPKTPQVVLVVGVNGSGKTTTIGKLASQFKAAGKNVVIAAGDTFRAAAVEQLQVWGERAGVPVLTAPEGSDPASLAFDAMKKAQTDGADLLMIDTAGRLQNRSDLMEELAKIVRVIRKTDETAPHNTFCLLYTSPSPRDRG